MKKILVASTALSLLGGAALAEVKVTGDGRMGIQYTKADVAGSEGEWDFTSRVRIIFTASGETDGGLAFGASVRADHYDNDQANNGENGNIWISGSFGKIAMGDVDSAAEAAVGQLYGVGLDDREWDHIAYVGAGSSSAAPAVSSGTRNPVALYSYSFGDGNVYVSLADGNPTESYGIAGNYTFGDFTVAAGYESTEDTDQLSVGLTAKFGDFAVKGIYAQSETDGIDAKPVQYGLGVNYAANGIGASAFYRVDDSDVAGVDNVEIYGVGGSYDLGGGAKVVGGYAHKDGLGDHFSVGVAMTF